MSSDWFVVGLRRRSAMGGVLARAVERGAVCGRLWSALRAGSRQCPLQVGCWDGQVRLPRHLFALCGAHDAIKATARSGSLSSTTRGWGYAARRARNLVVSEPHAA